MPPLRPHRRLWLLALLAAGVAATLLARDPPRDDPSLTRGSILGDRDGTPGTHPP